MLLTIFLLVALTIAAATRIYAMQMPEQPLVFRTEADRPAAFGCNMAWLAIRTRDTHAVADAIGLSDATACNWNSGIGTIYDRGLGDSHVFVTPPVGAWTFVVGLSLPQPLGRAFADKCTPMLVSLAGRFPEVQYYVSFPTIDFFAWARMHDGRLTRAFAIGDEGIIWSKGKVTREEKQLGLKSFEFRGVKGRKGDAGGEIILHPTEDHVMRLAGRWSLDPTALDTARDVSGIGCIATAPSSWRVERLRKAG